jgi:predicted RNA methylase
MSAANAVIIGTAVAASRSPRGERRPLPEAARFRARLPIPRRIPHEFYPTPPEAVRALLSVESFNGPIWEPACGEGAIAKVLAALGHEVVSTDLYAYGFGQAGIDFLAQPAARARHIVTNPPYGHGLADAFMLKALRLTRQTGGKVALLLNLASLCHPRRTALWRQMPPARIYAIDGIVCWPEHRYGPAPEAFTRHRYCWAVWTAERPDATRFGWLSAGDFR